MRLGLKKRPERRGFDERLLFAAMFLALFGAARWFPFHRNPFICSFKQITGYPCFTCGMTRAWVDQVFGHPIEGIIQSPLGSMLFFMAFAFTAWTLVRWSFRLPSLRIRLSRGESAGIWIGSVVALVANWLYAALTGVA